MLVQVVLLCIASLVAAAPYDVPSYGNPAYGGNPAYEAKPEPYSFAYDTKDEYGTILTRKEEGDELGNKRGSYGYVDSYGIYRQVDYVADEHGFRAVVKTNEPGTESQNPADVEILSEAVPVKYDAPAAYSKAPVGAAYSRPAAVIAPTYAKPVGAVASAPLAPLAPLAPAAPLASPYGNHGPAVYGSASGAYGPVEPAYASAPEAYAPVPAAYGPAPAAYSSGPVYEPLSHQAYGGPSYEQLSDRASQSTESHAAY